MERPKEDQKWELFRRVHLHGIPCQRVAATWQKEAGVAKARTITVVLGGAGVRVYSRLPPNAPSLQFP